MQLTFTVAVDVDTHRFTNLDTVFVTVLADDDTDATLLAAQIVGATFPDDMVLATRILSCIA